MASKFRRCVFFSASEVEDAVSRLIKPHKSDGSSELATDHFINGDRDCLSLSLSLSRGFLINCYYGRLHDHVPDSFSRSTIVPKSKGYNVNQSDSANFRGIA